MQAPSTRSQLRAATRAAHDDVDALFANGLRSARDYRVYLRGMHAFAVAVDLTLSRHSESPWHDWSDPARVDALRADLAVVGAAPLEKMPALETRGCDAGFAGLVYVIEGSALGARLLVRDARRLGFTASHGATFLHAHADGDGGQRWRRYLGELDAAAFDRASTDVVLQSANDAFALVAACFSDGAAVEREQCSTTHAISAKEARSA